MYLLTKLFALLMDKRLREQTSLDNRQLGFKKGVGTREAIVALVGLVASSKARKLPLLAAFVDFSKAFDKVPRGLLLRRLREEGVSEYDVLMVHAMYFDVWARVDGADREIQEGAGVKQGDLLSPLLFFLFINNLYRHIRLSAHREDKLEGEESEKDGTVSDERSIESRTRDYPWAGRLRGVGIAKGNKKTEVAVKRKRGKVRVSQDDTICVGPKPLESLGYADDLVLFGRSSHELQARMNKLAEYCRMWGFTVNLKKTKVMRLSCSKENISQSIFFKGKEVERTGQYKYLGCTFFEGGSLRSSVRHRLGVAERALGGVIGLCVSLGRLSPTSKIMLFRGLWIPVALYRLEAFSLSQADMKALNDLQLRFVR
uniref:Reverse transcriptase domain-containing protein n=1 Tax=Chromera velia CCMP2878 TaxID=1169474 RepID=A0A0K6SAY7_9ALVE|eukprot:Cvel_11935.t2-p1 / transcript=Cvel_11935.t2 / gene=Cvel_11935 / organism=Chromera_velia_CCMP2878 / gene_product=hypothetical protein / transcript_product=hypothetical protein / location=Cvel_scaffold764:50641-51753(+) / protein_length=371 / sequence_SO=supercontig / SO=protein_coding / is_pseudo=false